MQMWMWHEYRCAVRLVISGEFQGSRCSMIRRNESSYIYTWSTVTHGWLCHDPRYLELWLWLFQVRCQQNWSCFNGSDRQTEWLIHENSSVCAAFLFPVVKLRSNSLVSSEHEHVKNDLFAQHKCCWTLLPTISVTRQTLLSAFSLLICCHSSTLPSLPYLTFDFLCSRPLFPLPPHAHTAVSFDAERFIIISH